MTDKTTEKGTSIEAVILQNVEVQQNGIIRKNVKIIHFLQTNGRYDILGLGDDGQVYLYYCKENSDSHGNAGGGWTLYNTH